MSRVKSPSKFTRLDYLKQIRRDHYIGIGGQEFCAEEVDQMIVEKEITTAERKLGEWIRDERKRGRDGEKEAGKAER